MDWVELHKWVRHFTLSTYFHNLIIQGWNSWNHFHRNISEKLIQQTADAIIATGLAAAGYEYRMFFRY
jgi:hypothetical protein